jgi:hypothetical protein
MRVGDGHETHRVESTMDMGERIYGDEEDDKATREEDEREDEERREKEGEGKRREEKKRGRRSDRLHDGRSRLSDVNSPCFPSNLLSPRPRVGSFRRQSQRPRVQRAKISMRAWGRVQLAREGMGRWQFCSARFSTG